MIDSSRYLNENSSRDPVAATVHGLLQEGRFDGLLPVPEFTLSQDNLLEKTEPKSVKYEALGESGLLI